MDDNTADVIAILESYLEQARKGEITGVAIAAVTSLDSYQCTYTKVQKGDRLLGSVARLQIHILEEGLEPEAPAESR